MSLFKKQLALAPVVLMATAIGGDAASAQNLFDFLIPKTVCFIHHQGMGATTPYIGPDGRAIGLTPQQCAQANRDAQQADLEEAQQRRAWEVEQAERASRETRAEEQKRATAAARAARIDEQRGFKHVSLRDLLLDARAYADSGAGVAVSGFYKLQGRHDERLYASYDDLMMHAYQSVPAQYVGLISEGGSRPLREQLMQCGAAAGCNVTLLGHINRCVETNVFGAAAGAFCLVAEDLGASGN